MKLLIANRGEIAVRIIKACQEMGIQTVAIYSEADINALHRRLADEAMLIGPPPPAESYLQANKIIDVAQQTNCQAIHPGFGFLAENADFALAVQTAGLIFIGPTPEAIQQMGSKITARKLMAQAGVPIVPGYQASDKTADLLKAAQEIGFPLLIKTTAGGGGKGMRLVESMAGMADSLSAARREALSAFGDDTVYLEKYVSHPHHIEFQIFGNRHGEVIHLFERECSIQRRHQKIIEETPSPLLDETLRQRMAETAIKAAQAVNYSNAGTLEFLVDGTTRDFYFLEMNTRLQVEHPITEMVTGVDLVKWQIREALELTDTYNQDDIQQRGHAVECRIYAEDPANQFLPTIGKLLKVVEPTGLNIRVDTGTTSGDEVTVHYDPMLAKLVVWAENRAEAIRKMDWALRHYVILGDVTTNIPFLLDVINHPEFIAGNTPTSFLDEHLPNWQPSTELPIEALLATGLVEFNHKTTTFENHPNHGASVSHTDPYSPWLLGSQFRVMADT